MKKPRHRHYGGNKGRTWQSERREKYRSRKTTHIHGGYEAHFYHDQEDFEEGYPINRWLWDHLERRNYSFQWHYYDGGVINEDWKGVKVVSNSIWFRREEDAMLFGLRWQGHSMLGKKVPVDYDGRDRS